MRKLGWGTEGGRLERVREVGRVGTIGQWSVIVTTRKVRVSILTWCVCTCENHSLRHILK